ncbi:FAD binding domain-containing protein [Kitasatospora sp. CMC57]|uniref:FAD binding domain-containing protein n=1 Tax=Kitasatospora sp. CMC57 TaxID=3231513 RepID=A0AB33K7X6_9ACTN
MRGGRVAVVGGSIAGCAIASAAARAGADEVVVLERTSGQLADRGVGLCIHNDRAVELRATGVLAPDIATHRLTRRRWLVRDGEARTGRVIWDQPFPFHSYHWGLLWRGLRAATPAAVVHRQGAAVESVRGYADRAEVRLTDGSLERFDLVVGADGYRSVVREAVCPGVRPSYAGYVCWRGSYPADRLAALGTPADGGTDWPVTDTVTIGIPGGSCVIYRIPGPDGPMVNWVFYAAPPETGLRLDDPTSFPPGEVIGELADQLAWLAQHRLPPYWAGVIGLTPPERTSVQPIYDLETGLTVAERLLLAGDAASVVRPHNTSGAAKALQDATAFEVAWRQADSWSDLLSAYQAARGTTGRDLVALARRLGSAQAERTPDWSAMTESDMAAWWREQLDGMADIGGQALGHVRSGASEAELRSEAPG